MGTSRPAARSFFDLLGVRAAGGIVMKMQGSPDWVFRPSRSLVAEAHVLVIVHCHAHSSGDSIGTRRRGQPQLFASSESTPGLMRTKPDRRWV